MQRKSDHLARNFNAERAPAIRNRLQGCSFQQLLLEWPPFDS